MWVYSLSYLNYQMPSDRNYLPQTKGHTYINNFVNYSALTSFK